MAKQYYDLEETLAKLKVTEAELKQMARDGQIREFRHGGILHFKVDDVDSLARELGGEGSTGDLALVPAEDDSVAGLSGTDMTGSGAGGPGLSGSDMLSLADQEPEPGDVKKDDTVITSVGISVFDDQELEIDADPMAKTVLSDTEGESLGEGATGSGSGLLDLTRESDDTSLGAELLDEIYSEEAEEAEVAVGEATRAGLVEEVAAEEETVFEKAPVAAPVAYRQVEDPLAMAFTGLLIVGLVMMALVGAVCAAIVQEAWPGYLNFIRDKILFFAGGGVGVAVIVVVVGWFLGRQASGRETAAGASEA